jgi:hypothetical protein
MDGRFAGFDTVAWVRDRHPGLASRAEPISHWSAYHAVNPILLTHLLARRFEGDAPSSDDVQRFAATLAAESRAEPASTAKPPVFSGRLAATFGLSPETSYQAVQASSADLHAAGLSRPLAEVDDQPPALDLPFARPQAWQFNGVHTWTGNDDGSPMSSIDFTRTWALDWGDDTLGDRVTASHDGVVSLYSSCFVQVQHDRGWATRYYHLDNVTVKTGDVVRAGDTIGNYASEEEQAICSGGNSTGPHLHFALLKDGQYYPLQNVALSGYRVFPGTSSYDSNRNRMWLEKRGTRYYAFAQAIRIEEGDNTIDYRYNGMWYSPDSDGHGINVEITEFPAEDGTRKVVFLVVYTYDDAGLANYYVGNVDYERWRSDEGMVVEMLQTSGGDFSSLQSIDFADETQVRRVGQAEIGFDSCTRGWVALELDERDTQRPVEHFLELTKVIGAPTYLCEQASVPPAR